MDSCRAGRFILSIVLTALLLGGSSTAQAQSAAAGKQLTVERIFSQPSLSGSPLEGMEWKADGKRLSYLRPSATSGKTELWEMDAASGEQRRLIDAEKLAALRS